MTEPVSPRRLARSEGSGCRAVRISEIGGVLPECPLVFNTVPALILTDELLQRLPREAVIIELASAPYGDDAGDSFYRKSYSEDVSLWRTGKSCCAASRRRSG